ncbi:hypothetical protein [Crocosphaera sp.]|uniref:DUF6888 family protein n=1 Tax=Crocosphaera sp. TaxID=2729996 RepID=UPI003431D054
MLNLATKSYDTRMPTEKQAITCLEICHRLSNLLQPIYVFRYDNTFKTVYILAGDTETIEILVYANGNWRFVS